MHMDSRMATGMEAGPQSTKPPHRPFGLGGTLVATITVIFLPALPSLLFFEVWVVFISMLPWCVQCGSSCLLFISTIVYIV